MNTQQLIKQIETRVKETQNSINQWKEVIQQRESDLLNLNQQLQEIKLNINKK